MSTSIAEASSSNSSSEPAQAVSSTNLPKNYVFSSGLASTRPETPVGWTASTRTRFATGSTSTKPELPASQVPPKVPYSSTLPPLPPSEIHTGKKSRKHAFFHTIKHLLPCVISVFLGAVFTVNKRIAFLSGTAEYAFLIIVIYTLFFHPAQHTVGNHIQVTAIGISGAVIGIGWSALGYYLGCLSNRRSNIPEGENSVGARAACATFLAFMSFVAADLKSRFPRLTTGCLLSVFTSIWLLAITVQEHEMHAAPFLGMLYAVVFAAGISLLVSLVVFPASSNKLLARQLIDALGATSELLLATLHLFQADSRSIHALKDYRQLCERVIQLRQTVTVDVERLRPAYEDARYEISYALFPLEQYEAFINLSLKLQTVLVSRMGMKLSDDIHTFELASIPVYELDVGDSEKPAYLRTLVDELGRMNLFALKAIRSALAKSSYLPDVKGLDLNRNASEEDAVHQQLHELFRERELQNLRQRVDEIVETFRTGIVDALESAIQTSGKSGEGRTHRPFRSAAFRDCFFFTSLVELSSDIQDGLRLASGLPQPSTSNRRIWTPAFSTLLEISKSTSTFSPHTEEDEAAQREWEKVNENSKVQKASLVRAASNAELPFIQLSKSRPRNFSFRNLRTYAVKRRSAFKHWWSSPEVYSFRVRLDERIQAFKHSRHLKHAFKCAFGISLLTLPGHLPASNAGYRWFEDVRGPWIAISFLYCLQTSTAATYRDAVYRTLGTLFGAIYGLVGQKIAGTNPYGLVAVMTFQAFFTNYLIVFKPRYQGIGIVGQLTVPAILFSARLGLYYTTAVELAFLRAQDIEIGILSALLVNSFLWPYHGRVQLITACAKATDRLIKLYLSMSRQVLQRNYRMTEETRHRYEKLEDETRMILTRASNLCEIVHVETSLLPKPIKKYRKLIRDLNELLNLWSGLRAIRQHIPRKLTVLDVLPQRTELISSILIILHAISHSLHTHSPVPQFLPHPQSALQHLISAIEEHIEQVATSPISSGPSTAQMPSIHSTLLSSSVGESDKVPFPSHASSAGPGSDTTGAKLGFSFAFALAENEAISEAVETLGDIIETCKDLYGVASFIQQEEVELLGDVSSYLHTPVRTPTRSARHSFSAETLRSPSSSSMHDRPTSSRARELRQDLQ